MNHVGLGSVMEGLISGDRLVLLPMKGNPHLSTMLFSWNLRVGIEWPGGMPYAWRWQMDGRRYRQELCQPGTHNLATSLNHLQKPL